MYRMVNIGAMLDVVVAVIPEGLDDSAAAGDGGEAIDLQAYDLPQSAVLMIQTGDSTGGPSSLTVDAKVQHRDTATADWEDLGDQPDQSDPAITQITGNDEAESVNVNLVGAKRYIRALVTVDHTGGTNPTTLVSGAWVFGGAFNQPR